MGLKSSDVLDGLVVGAIAKPKLGMQPEPFGEACYASWQDGDSTKS